MSPDPTYGGEQTPTLLTCQMQNSPATDTSDLFVLIPSMGPQPFGPTPFMPRISGGVALLPQVGDSGIVGIDENGNPWLVCWHPGQ